MNKVADLHIHTSFSDGTFTPTKVIEYSKVQGLSGIAITDHDSCEGIEEAIIAAKDMDIEVIPAVELTAELGDEEMHILGYFIDWQNHSFIKKLDDICRVRRERAKEILKRLKNQGIEIQEEELFKASGPGSVGRLHIANLMHKKGAVSSIKDAFTKYIGNNGSCYVKRFKLSPKEAVSIIKDVGGVSVLAHPKTINFKDKSLDSLIAELVEDGIQGIEVFHSDHKEKDVNKLKEVATKYSLLITGGSDCHGLGKKEVLIGRVKVPYELVEKLRRAAMSADKK